CELWHPVGQGEMPSPGDPPPAAPRSAAFIRTSSTFNRFPLGSHWLGYFPFFLFNLTLSIVKNHTLVYIPVDNSWPARRRVRHSTAPSPGRATRPRFGRDCPHDRNLPAAPHPDGAARQRTVGDRGCVAASLVATRARPAAVAGPGG